MAIRQRPPGVRSFTRDGVKFKRRKTYGWCGVQHVVWEGHPIQADGTTYLGTRFHAAAFEGRDEIAAFHAQCIAHIQAGRLERPERYV